AAAIAGHPHAIGLDDPHRFIETEGSDLVAPGVYRPDAMTHTGFDRFAQIPLLPHSREVDRQPVGVHARPCTASSFFMRAAASSGSCKPRALSASRKSSARCNSDRALSCPPTMIKWSCN